MTRAEKPVKTDYGSDWYKTQQNAQKQTTIKEDLGISMLCQEAIIFVADVVLVYLSRIFY